MKRCVCVCVPISGRSWEVAEVIRECQYAQHPVASQVRYSGRYQGGTSMAEGGWEGLLEASLVSWVLEDK